MTGSPTALDILRGARRILEDGGDPKPCALGQWCPYCCASIAKTDFDEVCGSGVDTLGVLADVIGSSVGIPMKVRSEDLSLLYATRLIGNAGARTAEAFTKESAIGFVDAAIEAISATPDCDRCGDPAAGEHEYDGTRNWQWLCSECLSESRMEE